MLELQQYGSSDDDETEGIKVSPEDVTSHLKPLGSGNSIITLQNKMQVCLAPAVVPMVILHYFMCYIIEIVYYIDDLH